MRQVVSACAISRISRIIEGMDDLGISRGGVGVLVRSARRVPRGWVSEVGIWARSRSVSRSTVGIGSGRVGAHRFGGGRSSERGDPMLSLDGLTAPGYADPLS